MKIHVSKKTYTNVYSSIIYHSLKLETLKCPSTGEWNVIHLYNDISLRIRKEQTYCYVLPRGRTSKVLCQVKKPEIKDYILCDSIYILFPEKFTSVRDRKSVVTEE